MKSRLIRATTASLRVIAVSLFVAVICPAQSNDPPEVKALPVWPADGKPSLPAGGQVFRDSATGEIVVSYPALDNANRRVTFRFWLQNRVDPRASVEISRNSEGLYVYRYDIENGSGAKTPIWFWAVVGPGSDPSLAISHPVWDGINPKDPVAPQAFLRTAKRGAFLSWMGVSTPIAPGSKVAAFQIISNYKPGFTTAYATGDGGIHAPDEMTEAVAEQLLPLQRAPVMSKPFLTIGPRFGPDVSSQDIAAIYLEDIRDLCALGLLDKESPFLREVQDVLSHPRPWLFQEVPHSLLDSELASALSLSLPNN
jgi:hypothetical protein